MSEIIKFNWLQPLSMLCLIAALALAIVFLSFKIVPGADGQSKKNRILLAAAAFLALSGILCCFKMPSRHLLISTLTGMDNNLVLKWDDKAPKFFSARELIIDYKNAQHPRNRTDIRENTSCLFFNGFISTPFIHFEPGEYSLTFSARGSFAFDQNAILSAEFSAPDADNYLIAAKQLYFRLTPTLENYKMDFSVSGKTIGRIRLHFVNDHLEPNQRRDRNAFIKDVMIWKKP